MSTKADIIVLGVPKVVKQKSRTTAHRYISKMFAVSGISEKGKRWLKKHFNAGGMEIFGETFFHIGNKRLARHVENEAKTHGLKTEWIEL